MALPEFSMRQLLEAGAHFGHQTHRWNPKMDRYIFGEKSNIHIIDLSQTVPLLHQALLKVREVAAGEVLHREVVQLRLGHADVVDRDDVRVRKRRERARLLHEAAREVRVVRERRLHDLQRDLAVERRLQGKVDGRHAALADLALDEVARNLDHALSRVLPRTPLRASVDCMRPATDSAVLEYTHV